MLSMEFLVFEAFKSGRICGKMTHGFCIMIMHHV